MLSAATHQHFPAALAAATAARGDAVVGLLEVNKAGPQLAAAAAAAAAALAPLPQLAPPLPLAINRCAQRQHRLLRAAASPEAKLALGGRARRSNAGPLLQAQRLSTPHQPHVGGCHGSTATAHPVLPPSLPPRAGAHPGTAVGALSSGGARQPPSIGRRQPPIAGSQQPPVDGRLLTPGPQSARWLGSAERQYQCAAATHPAWRPRVRRAPRQPAPQRPEILTTTREAGPAPGAHPVRVVAGWGA